MRASTSPLSSALDPHAAEHPQAAGAVGRQARSHLTRLSLIGAAIICLSEQGFGGTTMPRVAAVAGVSPGPRQYYFPTREDLFEAVVDHLVVVQRRWYALRGPQPEPASALQWLVLRSLGFNGSPPQIAMLELRLALKHQPALAARITPRILELEAGSDRAWISLLRNSGRSENDILALRRLLSAVSRGMAFEPEFDVDRLAAMVTHICCMMGIAAPTNAIDSALAELPVEEWDPVLMSKPVQQFLPTPPAPDSSP